MVYETFLETVRLTLEQRLGADYHLTIQSIQKINGITLDGICFGRKNEKASPTIYLNSYFEELVKGRSLEDILSDITELIAEKATTNHLNFEDLLNQEQIKNRIIYRLINESANQELLSDIPHISYPALDLCLIFYLFLPSHDDNLITALIHNRHKESWNLSDEELLLEAKKNTPHYFPARIRPLSEVIEEIVKKTFDTPPDENEWKELFGAEPFSPLMYVLSNNSCIYGSACIFYEGILKDFSSCCDSDLVILPSSIHEVLVIPFRDDLSIHELAKMVYSVNEEEVPESDRLSNHIYFYSKSKDELTVAFTSSAPI